MTVTEATLRTLCLLVITAFAVLIIATCGVLTYQVLTLGIS